MTDETEDIVQDNLQHKSRNLIDLPNLDVPIFRVFSVERLIQVFDEKKITLVKPEKWDDPFENLVFQGTAIGNDGIRIHFDNIRKSFYGQCWTLNTDESDALWRIYSSDKKGVRVKSTIQKLFDTFFNPNDNWALISYFIGRVAYDTAANLKAHLENPAVLHDYIFDTSARGQVMTLLWKRTEFQHEEEVRIIYRANDSYYDTSNAVYKFDVDPRDLFDELLFEPRMPVADYQQYEQQFRGLGFAKPILRSELYQLPNLNLRLNV